MDFGEKKLNAKRGITMKETIRNFKQRISNFLFEQHCLPWFILKSLKKNQILSLLQCKFNFVATAKYVISSKKQRADCSFVIPHKDCPTFLEICLNSIHRYANNLNYEIIITDDFSQQEKFEDVKKRVSSKVSLYRFKSHKSHSFALEWLYHRAHSPYVIVLDQDSLLVSPYFQELIEKIQNENQILLFGLRDQCLIRCSPLMVHPAFLLLHKERCNQRLQAPLFFGEKPLYQNYKIGCPEPYHSLSCKALSFDPASIGYLDTHQTKYGFGTIGYFEHVDNPVVYHQWYSSQVYNLFDESAIDSNPMPFLKGAADDFCEDCRNNQLDFKPVHYKDSNDAVDKYVLSHRK